MKTYKGFNKDLTCRGFQYEEGKEYEIDGEIECCKKGFHACENPIVCLSYYSPAESVFYEVEQSGQIKKDAEDSKVCSSKIKIGAKLDILGFVNASIEYAKTHYMNADKKTGNDSISSNTDYYSVSSNTGNYSVSSNTGDCSASSNTGDCSASSNTGECSISSNTGYCSVSSNTGECSISSNTGNYSVSSNTGFRSVSSNTGNYSVSSNTGDWSVSSNTGKHGIAVAWGQSSKAKGEIGNYLVLSEWGEWNGKEYPLLNAKMVKVDGVTIKANTEYQLVNGEVVEAKE